MKKIVAFLLVVALIVCLCACFPKHYDENNILELYDKEWIVGKSREQIEDKYGEFKREYVSDAGENVGSYYVNFENSGMDPSYNHDTYFVIFNDEDIAVDAYFRKTSIGG